MTTSRWQTGGREQAREASEARASIVDQQRWLRLSAAESQPSPKLRARVVSSLQDPLAHKTSRWMWLVPATAAMVTLLAFVLSYWKLHLPQPPSRLPIVTRTIPDARPVVPSAQKQVVRQHQSGAATRPQKRNRQPEILQAKRPAVTNDLPIAQFDSLLYCDPFSCGDPMQVIRVEVPAASVGRAYRPLARNGFLNAEVIVGADGLTRAVRFTK